MHLYNVNTYLFVLFFGFVGSVRRRGGAALSYLLCFMEIGNFIIIYVIIMIEKKGGGEKHV